MFFADYARSVTLLVRGDSLLKSMSHYLVEQLKTKKNVRAELSSEIAAVHGDERLEAIDVTNRVSGRIDRKDAASIFIFIGADAETGWLPDEIARDPRGYILTGSDARSTGRWHEGRDPYLVETTVPGIFAAGDVRAGSVKRCAAGVGEGSIAIAFVHQYLQ
jgi:thioredoxin reductase (NADPH)